MKLTIDRISLLRPLGQVQSVVERRNTIPILANVVLQAADGSLMMTATDMDMDIATQVECAVGTAGTTTVSAHLLYDIVRKLPDGAEVEIAVADGHAMIPYLPKYSVQPNGPSGPTKNGRDGTSLEIQERPSK